MNLTVGKWKTNGTFFGRPFRFLKPFELEEMKIENESSRTILRITHQLLGRVELLLPVGHGGAEVVECLVCQMLMMWSRTRTRSS